MGAGTLFIKTASRSGSQSDNLTTQAVPVVAILFPHLSSPCLRVTWRLGWRKRFLQIVSGRVQSIICPRWGPGLHAAKLGPGNGLELLVIIFLVMPLNKSTIKKFDLQNQDRRLPLFNDPSLPLVRARDHNGPSLVIFLNWNSDPNQTLRGSWREQIGGLVFFLPFRSSTRSVINRRKIKNSLCPCEEFEDLKLPTLDTWIWIGRLQNEQNRTEL